MNTKPIHPSLAIACGDLLSHAMWVTGCSDCDVFVDYAGHIGCITVRVRYKECDYMNDEPLCSFRLDLDVYDYELAIAKVQYAIDGITVHRGKCSVSAHLPKDGETSDCVESDDVFPF